ncbi:MAG: prepilin-type N-terminal cleavage/methylation domain-containing protein [Planctomycetota bacterium]|nr:prepilin-type N-terminal cleavage/methylation domain-containing protein [Planctomycetota bacterium]MDI6787217.1 prepilin-type N-terminal cleavage/methylation domain-containing protein [Planctomycetota bacterium]
MSIRERGFTLVEILVVMGIIVILMGVVVGGGGMLKQRARKEATQMLIRKIIVGLNEYHLCFSDYPPSEDEEYEGSQNLYYFLGQPLEIEQGYDPATGRAKKTTFGPAILGGFKTNEYNTDKYIIDAWQRVIFYKKPGADHSSTGGKDNTSFVDIESAGLNGRFDDDGTTADDDINNWKMEKYLSR